MCPGGLRCLIEVTITNCRWALTVAKWCRWVISFDLQSNSGCCYVLSSLPFYRQGVYQSGRVRLWHVTNSSNLSGLGCTCHCGVVTLVTEGAWLVKVIQGHRLTKIPYWNMFLWSLEKGKGIWWPGLGFYLKEMRGIAANHLWNEAGHMANFKKSREGKF